MSKELSPPPPHRRKIMLEREKIERLIKENEVRKFTFDELFQPSEIPKPIKESNRFTALTILSPRININAAVPFISPQNSLNSIISLQSFPSLSLI